MPISAMRKRPPSNYWLGGWVDPQPAMTPFASQLQAKMWYCTSHTCPTTEWQTVAHMTRKFLLYHSNGIAMNVHLISSMDSSHFSGEMKKKLAITPNNSHPHTCCLFDFVICWCHEWTLSLYIHNSLHRNVKTMNTESICRFIPEKV